MAGADEGPGRNRSDPHTDAIRQRLSDLEGKLGRVHARNAPPTPADASARGAALGNALRLSTEMIAGVAVGGFIGWAFDQGLGTAPLMMVVFLFLGGGAGIWNVIRSAKAMQEKAGKLPGKDLPPDADED
jgi:ATP synthase protein I